jgi:hypothetical protein
MWRIHLAETDETVGMAGGWGPAKWPEREIAWIIWPVNNFTHDFRAQ